MSYIEIDGRRYYTLLWEDFERDADKLTTKISSSYKPDTLIGILRGGVTVANILSDILGIREVYVIGCKAYAGINEKSEVRIYHPLVVDSLNGRRVLLVDDVVDSGETLRIAMDRVIKPRNPLELRTATLHVKPRTNLWPDYYVREVDAWIIYPWERYEMSKLIASELLSSYKRNEALPKLSKIMRKDEEWLNNALKF